MKNSKRRCDFCRRWFLPDVRTYRAQYCCSNSGCQRERRVITNRNWRNRHPGYSESRKIKMHFWAKCNPGYWKKWRKAHPEYVSRDNHRRCLSYRESRISAKQNLNPEFTVEGLHALLNFFQRFSAKQNLIPRRSNSSLAASV